MTNSEIFRPWDVALVQFPFTDLPIAKKRPGLVRAVLGSAQFGNLYVIAMVTSNVEAQALKGDYAVADWQAAGLLAPSRARLGFVVTLKESLMLRKLGTLSARDQRAARKAWEQVFAL